MLASLAVENPLMSGASWSRGQLAVQDLVAVGPIVVVSSGRLVNGAGSLARPRGLCVHESCGQGAVADSLLTFVASLFTPMVEEECCVSSMYWPTASNACLGLV